MNKALLYPVYVILVLAAIEGYPQKAQVIGKPDASSGPFKITGRILDNKTNEHLIGANIFSKSRRIGTTTDTEGWFQLYLQKRRHNLQVSFIGYLPKEMVLDIKGEGYLEIFLDEDLVQLSEVIITSEGEDINIKGVTIGKAKLSIEDIAALPPFAGEVDVLKSITLLPGISTLGESSSGFNVRGGSADQNLILLGGAPLYNPSHLFGFFTAFNSDVIKDVTIYKGGIPARYGGRGSSVIDLNYRSGNMSGWEGKVTLGTVSSKLTVEGPLIKDKLSLLVAGRVFYANWILRSVKDPDISNSAASFNDVNANLNYKLNSNNNLRYSFYRSSDDFKFANDTTFQWNNLNHVVEWNHSFNNRLSMNLSGVISQYDFLIVNEVGFNNFELKSTILDQKASLRYDYIINKNNIVTLGAESKMIRIDPGDFVPLQSTSSITPLDIEEEQAIESGTYLQHDINFGDHIGFSYGLRYSDFRYIGEKTVFSYEKNAPRRDENIIGNQLYGKNETIQQYSGFEPRISVRWSFRNDASIKGGFNQIYQYIHLISNTSTIAPTDIWKLSDIYLKPTKVTQYSLGFFKNFFLNTVETSLEGFYKETDNIIEYKDGAQLLLTERLETQLVSGQGKAYGIEVFVKRKKGRLTGWASYTFSRSLRQVIGPYPEELINNGEWFPSNYDKPHDVTATMEYKLSEYVKTSAIFTYSSGQPVTYPLAKFNYYGTIVAYFENRNENRAPDYMRIDLSFTFNFNTTRKYLKGDLILSVYNLLGRKNVFSIFFDDVENSPPLAFKLSVLGTPFPSLSYSVKF